MTRDRASSFRLKRGLFVYHDEIYSDFFLFRAQKRGILKKVRFLPQEAIPKAKGLWSFALGIVLSPRLCGDNLPIFKSKRLHQIGVTPQMRGRIVRHFACLPFLFRELLIFLSNTQIGVYQAF